MAKTIILGVSGGIAAYKAASICSALTQKGYEVHVILTEGATKFITPLTFQTLSRQPVTVDTFAELDASVVKHIDLADRADLVVVAPATANVVGKMAHGLADDMLTTTLLATRAPILVAPAMNGHMYANAAVQANLDVLRSRGVALIEPDEGQLACGYVGKGRLAEPEAIVQRIEAMLQPPAQPLAGLRVLVSAGPTREAIDPVRYLTNRSSGKMGFAMARKARELGADVVLVAGPSAEPTPAGVSRVDVTSTREMWEAVTARMADAEIIVKSAAVADYRPTEVASHKIKKKSDTLVLTLEKTEDILAWIGQEKQPHQWIVGFAAETENMLEYAKDKLERKNLDMVVANDVSAEGAGFDTDTNIVTVLDRTGRQTEVPLSGKGEVASRIWQLILEARSQAGLKAGEAKA
jgi:phosphopantothenoylcysteine decarboxylase/phosphopantothenate--cysteine ligase